MSSQRRTRKDPPIGHLNDPRLSAFNSCRIYQRNDSGYILNQNQSEIANQHGTLLPPPTALGTRSNCQRNKSEMTNFKSQNNNMNNVVDVDDDDDHEYGGVTPRRWDSEGNASRSDYSCYSSEWNSYYHALEQDRQNENKDKSKYACYCNVKILMHCDFCSVLFISLFINILYMFYI